MACKGPEYIDCDECGTHHSWYDDCPVILGEPDILPEKKPCPSCAALRAELEEANAKLCRVKDRFIEIREYWNGSINERAMVDALERHRDICDDALSSTGPCRHGEMLSDLYGELENAHGDLYRALVENKKLWNIAEKAKDISDHGHLCGIITYYDHKEHPGYKCTCGLEQLDMAIGNLDKKG